MSYIAQAAIDFYEAMIAKGFQDWDSDDCCRFCDCRERGAHTADCPFGKFAVAVKNAREAAVQDKVAGELTARVEKEIGDVFREADGHPRCEIVCKYVRRVLEEALAAKAPQGVPNAHGLAEVIANELMSQNVLDVTAREAAVPKSELSELTAALEAALTYLETLTIEHSPDCSYGATHGPHGDFCDCGLKARRIKRMQVYNLLQSAFPAPPHYIAFASAEDAQRASTILANHQASPAPGAERFAALPAKICKGILFYPYDEGSYYEWALGRVERLVREALGMHKSVQSRTSGEAGKP